MIPVLNKLVVHVHHWNVCDIALIILFRIASNCLTKNSWIMKKCILFETQKSLQNLRKTYQDFQKINNVCWFFKQIEPENRAWKNNNEK